MGAIDMREPNKNTIKQSNSNLFNNQGKMKEPAKNVRVEVKHMVKHGKPRSFWQEGPDGWYAMDRDLAIKKGLCE